MGKVFIHPTLGKLGIGRTHPDYPGLRYCSGCERFKDPSVFTRGKAQCKSCRAIKQRDKYADDPELREYHRKKQLENHRKKNSYLVD